MYNSSGTKEQHHFKISHYWSSAKQDFNTSPSTVLTDWQIFQLANPWVCHHWLSAVSQLTRWKWALFDRKQQDNIIHTRWNIHFVSSTCQMNDIVVLLLNPGRECMWNFLSQVLHVNVCVHESYLPLLLALASVASVALGATPAAGAACKTHSPSAPPSASGGASYSLRSS